MILTQNMLENSAKFVQISYEMYQQGSSFDEIIDTVVNSTDFDRQQAVSIMAIGLAVGEVQNGK